MPLLHRFICSRTNVADARDGTPEAGGADEARTWRAARAGALGADETGTPETHEASTTTDAATAVRNGPRHRPHGAGSATLRGNAPPPLDDTCRPSVRRPG
jgi:hypothetical protein